MNLETLQQIILICPKHYDQIQKQNSCAPHVHPCSVQTQRSGYKESQVNC